MCCFKGLLRLKAVPESRSEKKISLCFNFFHCDIFKPIFFDKLLHHVSAAFSKQSKTLPFVSLCACTGYSVRLFINNGYKFLSFSVNKERKIRLLRIIYKRTFPPFRYNLFLPNFCTLIFHTWGPA